MVRVANTSLLLEFSLFETFLHLFQLAQNGKYRCISLELRMHPWRPHPSFNWERQTHHRVFIFTSSKQRRIKKNSRRGGKQRLYALYHPALLFPLFPPFLSDLSLKIRSTNESRLFSGSRHSSIKRKIKLAVRCLSILSFLFPFIFNICFCTIILVLFFTLDFFRYARAYWFCDLVIACYEFRVTSGENTAESIFLIFTWIVRRASNAISDKTKMNLSC